MAADVEIAERQFHGLVDVPQHLIDGHPAPAAAGVRAEGPHALLEFVPRRPIVDEGHPGMIRRAADPRAPDRDMLRPTIFLRRVP